MNRRELPTAVFDSGVGGVSVLRALVELMPNENFYYYGDSANAPYGTRPVEEIRELTFRNLAMMYEKGIKGIVVACNTATSAAVRPLRSIYTDLPIVGIEPALKPAALMKPNPTVLVLATPMTIHGEKFHRLLARYEEYGKLYPISCPGMMELVEAGKLTGAEVETYLHGILDPYLNQHVDSIVLGCTHYPFLKKAIRNVVGPGIELIDGSDGVARRLKSLLTEQDMLNDSGKPGKVVFESSIPEKAAFAKYLLELPEI